jgi:hypothetical protein
MLDLNLWSGCDAWHDQRQMSISEGIMEWKVLSVLGYF